MKNEDMDNGQTDSSEPTFKRRRKDESADPLNPEPSKVVHVRNLSNRATEADLLEALQHFGAIAYITCMQNKRMALVEFEDLQGSKACVTYSQNSEIYVAGQPALFNFSTSKTIQRVGLESENPNHVVIVTVSNAQYPVNVDVIARICKAHGEVRRIAIIRRYGIQALVEFDSIESARKAKQGLNGADIYSGCNTLKVEYAKPENVKVHRNDSDQWDFTLPPGTGGGGQSNMPYNGPGLGAVGGPGSFNMGGGGGPGGFNMGPGMMGGDGRGPMRAGMMGPPNMGGPGPYGGGMGGSYGPQGGYNDGYGGGSGPDDQSYVVMVYGVNHDKWDCDKLFNLMCLYGNVNKIKFMKSKPDTAMVEMGSPQQVHTAINYLHGAPVFDSKLALRPSKQPYLQAIREPFELPSGAPSFKDFTGSRNQRFSTHESAMKNRLVRPTNVLHWYNAPSTMTQEALLEMFEKAGAPRPVECTVFPTKSERSSSGTIEFEKVEDAIDALMLVNHTPIDSPVGRIPYIYKLAFAGSREGRPFTSSS